MVPEEVLSGHRLLGIDRHRAVTPLIIENHFISEGTLDNGRVKQYSLL